jgi:hypothetical protein
MRLSVVALLILATAGRAIAQAPAPDTLVAQFLFVAGDTAFIRCHTQLEPDDSLVVHGFGPLRDSEPPIYKFELTGWSGSFEMGDTLYALRFRMPRRAADLILNCDAAVWDPITLESGSAYAAAGLVHRSLFTPTEDGGVQGDLASSWSWQGRDLFVVIDTTNRFGDGSPIDAYAVKQSLERYIWYHAKAPGYAWFESITGVEGYRKGRTNHVIGLVPRSRDTLQFNLSRPFYALPDYLAARSLGVVKWQLQGSSAPVAATAGHYSMLEGDILMGQPPEGGRMELLPPQHARTAQVKAPGNLPGTAAVKSVVPMPRLVIIRAAANADPALLTFLNFSLDRDAFLSAARQGKAHFPPDIYPSPDTDLELARAPSVNLEQARKARDLIRDKSELRVYAGPDFKSTAVYLSTVLKAWRFEIEVAESPDACDLYVEAIDFDTYDPDAYAEAILTRLERGENDSLVNLLLRARGVAEDDERHAAYRSLLARIAELQPYVVLYQPVALFTGLSFYGLEWRTDAWRRPVGPIFFGRNRP